MAGTTPPACDGATFLLDEAPDATRRQPASHAGRRRTVDGARHAVRSLIRRLRGALLRLAFNRPVALVAGLACLGAAVWLAAIDAPWEGWVSDGAGLVAGATGAALILVALGGRRPDWVE